MKGIAYRVVIDFLDNKISLKQAREMIIKGDTDYAKRQRTWFKRNKSIHWVQSNNEAITLVSKFISNK